MIFSRATLNPIVQGFASLVVGLMGSYSLVVPSHAADAASTHPAPPLGPIGRRTVYARINDQPTVANSVTQLSLSLGTVESHAPAPAQWLVMQATKANGEVFTVSFLTQGPIPSNPATAQSTVLRYVLHEASQPPREFVHRLTGAAVLPTLGGWEYLWPQPTAYSFPHSNAAAEITFLGSRFALTSSTTNIPPAAPQNPLRLELRPDLWIGVPSNSRTRENVRRFDGSDYPMVRLSQSDYAGMIQAGMNCFRVDAEQARWIENEPVFYWGVGGADVRFPECLYRSHYIGPSLFFDEPAVGTRDHDIRPRLAKDPAFRKSLTPQTMFDTFRTYFHHAVTEGPPTSFIKGMQARKDVDLGTMRFPQANLYSWETMIATAAWQLTADPLGGPRSMVFEPPGRLGTRRTIPEMNMAYGCQLPPSNPASLADPVFGFLRGAARAANKDWGVSIYGAVNPSDAPFLLTHAYDLGATHFFFWDNYQLACVPYSECLALARILQAHAARHPHRDLDRLKHAADTLILLPPGYDLGHVQMGRGNLWGITELNLERRNATGTRYRTVMGNAFIEVERCIRLGLPFDLAWDLPGLTLSGYREVVRVTEEGRLRISNNGRSRSQKQPRTPARPPGIPPRLDVQLLHQPQAAPAQLTARAQITEGSSPVYYTTGSDRNGVHHNARVLWELYGPQEEDYRTLLEPGANPPSRSIGASIQVDLNFTVAAPGRYRLRAAITDHEGRSAVAWHSFTIDP